MQRMLWSVAEVADMLGVHRNTVHREVQRGRLHSVRVGRLRRFRREDIEAYIDACMAADP